MFSLKYTQNEINSFLEQIEEVIQKIDKRNKEEDCGMCDFVCDKITDIETFCNYLDEVLDELHEYLENYDDY